MKLIFLTLIFNILTLAGVRDSTVYIAGNVTYKDTTVVVDSTLNICADDTVRIIYVYLPDSTAYNYFYVPSDTICEPVILDDSLTHNVSSVTELYESGEYPSGSIVKIEAGNYNLSSKLNFNSNNVTYIGYGAKFLGTSGNNGNVTINGSNVLLKGIEMESQHNQQMVNVYGDNVTLEDCIVSYPDNNSGNHLVIIKPPADNFTALNTTVDGSGRTIVWVESNLSEAADNAQFIGCTFKNYNNHYAIQVMPLTNRNGSPQEITGLVIRDSDFIGGSYESAIYLRKATDWKIYNNLFINSGAPLDYVEDDEENNPSVVDANGIFAFNTYMDETHIKFWLRSYAANNIQFKNNIYIRESTADYKFLDFRAFGVCANQWDIDFNLFYSPSEDVWTQGEINQNEGCTNITYSGFQEWVNETANNQNGYYYMPELNPDYTTVNQIQGVTVQGIDMPAYLGIVR